MLNWKYRHPFAGDAKGIFQSFMSKSDDIRASMEQLQQITERYAKSLECINNGMQSVSAASEETSAEIVHVLEILLTANTDMKTIEESADEAIQDMSGMNRDLSGYRIDESI